MQIFKNGKIHSFNSENTIYEAIAIENGKIVSIGNTEDVLERFKEREDKEIIDLKGKIVIPGFNDSHVHFMNYGYTGKKIRLNECKNVEELIALGKKNFTLWGLDIRKRMESGSFLGEKRIPEKSDLDKISKDIQCVIQELVVMWQ